MWWEKLIPGAIKRDTRRRVAPIASAALVSMLAAGVVVAPAVADSGTPPPNTSSNYSFKTLNDNRDVTLNQLLGVNNSGGIAGYLDPARPGIQQRLRAAAALWPAQLFGTDFPGSAQTQVTGLDNLGVTVGCWWTRRATIPGSTPSTDTTSAPWPSHPQQGQAPGRAAARRQRPGRRGWLLQRLERKPARLHVLAPARLLPRR